MGNPIGFFDFCTGTSICGYMYANVLSTIKEGSHMIELINRTDGGKVPVAFRFGAEIVTKQNLIEHVRNPSTPLAKAVIVGATICRFRNEQQLEEEYPRFRRHMLEEWKRETEVREEIDLALKHIPVVAADTIGIVRRKDVDFELSDTIISYGLWRLCVEKGLLGYKMEKKRLSPRLIKLLEIFFNEPGNVFTQEYLYGILYKRQLARADTTIIVAVSNAKAECRKLSETDGLIQSKAGTYWI